MRDVDLAEIAVRNRRWVERGRVGSPGKAANDRDMLLAEVRRLQGLIAAWREAQTAMAAVLPLHVDDLVLPEAHVRYDLWTPEMQALMRAERALWHALEGPP